MRHLIRLLKHAKRIREIKKKMNNDPLHSKVHEKEMWQEYNKVTEHKEAYYREKEHGKPEIVNAYITFRSMEGKARAIQAYNVSFLPRVFVELFCCMSGFFKKRKILQKHMPYVQNAIDPICILWENMNISFCRTFMFLMLELLIAMVLLFITFAAMAYLATFEKVRKDYVKSDCVALPELTAAQALKDHLKKNKDRVEGLMNCFCQQRYDKVGDLVVNQAFSDEVFHCKEWYDVIMLDKTSSYMLALLVALTNMVHQIIFNYLGKLFRPRDRTQVNFFKTFTIFAV